MPPGFTRFCSPPHLPHGTIEEMPGGLPPGLGVAERNAAQTTFTFPCKNPTQMADMGLRRIPGSHVPGCAPDRVHREKAARTSKLDRIAINA